MDKRTILNRLEDRSQTRRVEYHTERTFTVKVHPTVLFAIALAGTFFVLSVYFSH